MIDSGIGPLNMNLMPLEPLSPLKSSLDPAIAGDGGSPAAGFVDVLRNQLDQMIEMQNEAESVQQALAAGQVDNLHEALLTVQKADLALNFALELRNKVIEAYQEVSRMQI